MPAWSFASAIASRYALGAVQRTRMARVLLHVRPRAIAARHRRALHMRLALRVAHRMIVEDRSSVGRFHAATLVRRVDRHVAATRHVLERTLRVEQLPLQAGALPRLLAGASPGTAAAATRRVVVPPLPRVLRRHAIPSAPTEPPRKRDSAIERRQPTIPAIDVARLTDEVMRGIDKRIAAWRERRGRS